MRDAKKYLVEEVGSHLDKSDYVFLTNFDKITVEETGLLRASLEEHGAEFHVVKNSILGVASKARNYPDLSEFLNGPTAIVVGGDNPSGVAKALRKFLKAKDKNDIKVGVLGEQALSADDITILADLPTLDVLRAQFLGLLTTPAQQMVSVLNAVPTSVVTILKAKADKDA